MNLRVTKHPFPLCPFTDSSGDVGASLREKTSDTGRTTVMSKRSWLGVHIKSDGAITASGAIALA
ncbi:MAG TPA: hypothetical protein VNE42_11620 [Acidimicrobiales bacterium]|nr:hypothetical protein [Acidimicrobiales bacterium]